MEATIRSMTVEDFAQVYRLGQECYVVEDKPYNYWSIREVAHHLSAYPELCFVAEDAGRIVGFVLGEKSYEILESTGHLEWIAVAPEYRKHGLATRLIDTIVDVFQQLGRTQVVADV